MENYKEEIVNSRLGFLGSSDGDILAKTAELGYVPKSAHKRLAVCKGLIENQNIPYTDAVRTGDEIEMSVFNSLKASDSRWESNVRWESEKYKKKNVGLLCHPDFLLIDEEKKIINIYECKATKKSVDATRAHYNSQLFIEHLLGEEEARKRGKGWTSRLFLCHYSTDGLDLSQGVEYDPSRLTIRPVRFQSLSRFDMDKAMTLIDEFLEDFNEFYEGESVDEKYLPAAVKQQFDEVAMILAEIKEREKKVSEFKSKLYTFMCEKDIKAIKCEAFSMTRVDSTVSSSFDTKKYLADMREKHPRIAKRIEDNYKKTTVKNGYVLLNVKKTDNK